MGLDEEEFYRMSWRQYCYKSYGYMVRDARVKEPLRLIATLIYNSNVEAKDRTTPEKMMPLFTDSIQVKSIDPEDAKERRRQQKKRADEEVKKLNEKLAADHGRSIERENRG